MLNIALFPQRNSDNKNDNIHKNEVQNIGFGIPIKFPSQRRKKIFKSVHKKGNWTFVVKTVIWEKYDIRFEIPIEFSSQRTKELFKSVQKQRNWTFVVQTVI